MRDELIHGALDGTLLSVESEFPFNELTAKGMWTSSNKLHWPRPAQPWARTGLAGGAPRPPSPAARWA